jgi:hypothetical protein
MVRAAAPEVSAAADAAGARGGGIGRAAFALAVVLLVVAGGVLRVHRVATRSLWLDEAVIANAVARGSIDGYLKHPISVRPFGYLLVSGWIAAVSDSELALRLTSVVPALVALLLLVPLLSELVRLRVLRLVALFEVAFSGWLIGLARDFKPYAIESCLVILWLLLIARLRRRVATADVVALVVTMVAAPLVGHAPTLVVPIDAAVALALCWRHRARRAALCIGGGAVVAVVLAVVQYALVGANSESALATYWTPRFFVAGRDGGAVYWAVTSTAALVKSFVPAAQDPDAWAHRAAGILCLIGWGLGVVRFVVRREAWLLGVLVAPLAPPLLLGFAGRWPYGPERVNLALVVPVVLTSTLGWELLLERAGARTAAVAALLLVAVQLPLDREALLHQESRFGVAEEEVFPALRAIAAHEAASPAGGRRAVVVNHLGTPAVQYYTRVKHSSPAAVRALGGLVTSPWPGATGGLGDAVRAALARDDTVWILLAHTTDDEVADVDRVLAERPDDVFDRMEFPGVSLFGVRGRRPAQTGRATDGRASRRVARRSRPARCA